MNLIWKQLSLAMVAALWMAAAAAVREQIARQGGILTLSPAAFAAKISAEIVQNAEVIRRANIKID